MTIQAQVSVQSQVFIPVDYQIFAGLDVDKHSIAVTFCNHEGLLRSLRLPYSAPQLLNYVRKHFPEQQLAFVYEAGPTGFGLHDELVGNHHTCMVVESVGLQSLSRRLRHHRRRQARRIQTTFDSVNQVAKPTYE